MSLPSVSSATPGNDYPLLILVSGAPASGKTTLALRLAQELHLPALCKDAIKAPNEPLALDVPTLRVDTTDGYAPPFDRICAFALRPLS